MPKRVIDFDAMWGSDKLAACAGWAQAEYAWLYGLADASGCFEITNLRVIWGRVAAIRSNLTMERLEQIFAEFQDKGLLFVWEHEGKRYAHWTGSDVPGRLPPPSWRMRLEKFAPPVPKRELASYMAKFARGRAAFGGAGFRGEGLGDAANPRADCGEQRGVTRGLEEAQGQDLDLGLGLDSSLKRNWKGNGIPGLGVGADGARVERSANRNETAELNSFSSGSERHSSTGSYEPAERRLVREPPRDPFAPLDAREMTAKELAVAKELRVGRGPVCDPAFVRPEVLERVRLRDLARAKTRSR